MKPNKARLRKWVKTLRSGNYKQGNNVMHNEHDNTYCCLGVAAKVGLGIKSNLILDPDNCNYYGINTNPKLLTKQHGNRVHATTLNDSKGWSFNRIANAIERTFQL